MNKMSKKLGKRVLSWLLCVALVVALMPGMEMRRVKAATLNGSGTAEDPYQISNYTELLEFAKLVNDGQSAACAKLMNDIDASESANYNIMSGVRWMPIGDGHEISEGLYLRYEGTFDGQGHVIKGLNNTDNGAISYAGLFGVIGENGIVRKLFLEDGCFTGNSDVGGIAGRNYGSIEKCCNGAAVSGNAFVGGVVGSNYGEVHNCQNTGTVVGVQTASRIGGIVGINYGDIIENCHNAADIVFTVDNAFVGGIVGFNREGTVENCNNTGAMAVTGDVAYVGGIVGANTSDLIIQKCYNAGAMAVTGFAANVGGIVGDNTGGITIKDCYNAGAMAVTGDYDYVGGIVGALSNGTVENGYNIGAITITGENGYASGVVGVAGFVSVTVTNCYFDKEMCAITVNGVAVAVDAKTAMGNKSDTETVKGLTTAEMTGEGALARMGFSSENWNEHENDDDSGMAYYPFPKGFANDGSQSAEDWPARVCCISNYAQLKAFADLVNGTGAYAGKGDSSVNAVLTADIVCKNDPSDEEYATDWYPIGDGTKIGYRQYLNYTGFFDGQGHVIKGLSTPDNKTVLNAGLFGEIAPSGSVQNVGLEEVNIFGKNCAGGIAASNYGSIRNCHVSGTVSGTRDHYVSVGGVAGYNDGFMCKAVIADSYFTGTINASGERPAAGGVAGSNSGGQGGTALIENCYSVGTIVGNCTITINENYVGGVVGSNDGYNDGKAEVINCYHVGEVSATGVIAYAGGVAGKNLGLAKVTNCYHVGAVTASGDEVVAVGVIAYNEGDTVTDCFFDNEKSITINGQVVKGDDVKAIGYNECTLNNVKGLTTAEMTGANALANMGFSADDWYAHDNDADGGRVFYPHLKGFAYDGSQAVADWPTRVCYIDSYAKLKTFADIVNGMGAYAGAADPSANAVLTADIECKYNADEEYAADWMPIGDAGQLNSNLRYTGVFDGQGHVIKGLNNAGYANLCYAGFFGHIGEKGIVKNFGLEDERFGSNYAIHKSNIRIGGVAAINRGTIQNCYRTGSFVPDDQVKQVIIGGIAGYNYGTIEESYNDGAIRAEAEGIQKTGGVAGANEGTIQNCYNLQSVYAKGDGTSGICYVGGLVGSNYGTLLNSYNVQSVTLLHDAATLYAGGVAGYNTQNGKIQNCYSIQKVTANGVSKNREGYVGGVTGYNHATLSNCFYNTDLCGEIGAIHGADDETNNVKGLTMEEMSGSELEAWFKPSGSQETCWLYAENVEDSTSDKVTYYYPHLKGFNLTADGKQMDAKDIVQAGAWPAYTEYYWDGITLTEVTKTPTNGVSITWKYQLNSIKTEARVVGMSVEDDNAVYSDFIEMPGELGGAKVTEIGGNAFSKDHALMLMKLPDSLKRIDGYAFEDCTSLQEIIIPDGVTYVGINAFDYCPSLTKVTLSKQLKSIEMDCFKGCSGLTEMEIPATVASIGERAFDSCSKLETLYFEGTEADWNKISKGDYWNDETGLTDDSVKFKIRNVTFRVKNGKWSDGKTDDVTVTVDGYDAKLKSSDVPALGNPNQGYQEGSWSEELDFTNPVPNKGKTYVYTFEELPQHEITVKANSSMGNVYDGYEKTVSGFVSLSFTVDGKDYTVEGLTTSDPCLTEAGTVENKIDGTAVVKDADGNDVTKKFIVTTEDGTLEIAKREVTVSVADKEAEYNGNEQQGETAYAFTNVVSGQTATITYAPAKGKLVSTFEGSFAADSFKVVDGAGNDVTNNYDLTTKTAGKLTIGDRTRKYEITVKANSNTGNVYDGIERSASGIQSLTFNFDGNDYTVSGLTTSDPSSTNVCNLTNAISGTAVVKDAQGNDVTAQFTVHTTDGVLEITKREVSVSVADKEAEYNGNEQQGETSYAFANVVSGETATITYVPAKGTLASKTSYNNGSFEAGTFKVTDGAGNDVTANYDLTTMTAGKLLVKDRTNKYEITVIANSNIGNVYDGTEKSVSGFETLSFTVDGNAYTVSGLTTSDPSGTNVCNLTNAISGIAVVKDAQGNDVTAQFTVHTTEGVLTITKREVTVSVADKEVEYNGSEQQGETAYAFANLVSGETATITYAPAKGTLASKTSYNNGSFDAGTFKVTDGEGNDLTANYDLTAMTVGKLTIKDRTNKYEITVVAKSSTGNVYDGTEKTVSGFEKLMFQVEGKTYSVEGLSTSNPALTEAGTVANEITGTAVVKDSQGNDVTAQFTVSTENGTLEIAKRAVTVSVADKEVEYNGNEQQGETAYAFANVVSGETATITYKPAKGTLASKTSYDNGSFDKSTFKVTDGAGNDLTANYDLTTMTAGKLLVKDRTNKYEITVVANSNTGNVYDGIERSASGIQSLTFNFDGNDYTVSGLTTSDPASANACSLTNKISGTAVVKDADGNDVTAQFNVTTEDGTLEITKREVTVSAADKEAEYNGSEQQGETAYAFANLVSGQTATITYVPAKGTLVNTGSYDNGSFDKSTFKVTDGDGNDLTGNYDLTAATAGKLTIKDRTNKYGITVKANSNTGNVYDGTEKKAAGFETLSFTVDGNAYTVEGLTTHDPASTNVCSLVNMILGTAVVKDVEGNDVTAQFTVTTQDGTLEIGKRAVTVSVADRSVEYNGSEQQGETAYAFTNVAEGQTATIAYAPAKGKLAGTTGYDNGSFDKNSFRIVDGAGNDVTANYDLTAMTAGKLTIKDRTEKYVITVKSNGNTGNIYDRTEKSAKGFERLTFQVEGKTYTVEGLTSSNPKSTGVCSLTNEISGNAVVKDADGNDVTAQFTVRKEEGKLEIQPRAATVTVLSKSKEFGNQDPKFAVEVTGVLDGDALEITFVREIGEEPGTYKVSAKVTPNANYVITCVDGVLTINKDYVEDLRQKLLDAIAAGGEQTVNWNEGTSLPYDVMKLLQDHPQITLIFSYTYGGKDYKVTIPGKIARAYTSIPWYGPLYLYGAYGDGASLAGGDDSTLGSRIYKVVKGDCLSKIARKLGLKWVWLQKINNLRNPNLIYPGQEIRY